MAACPPTPVRATTGSRRPHCCCPRARARAALVRARRRQTARRTGEARVASCALYKPSPAGLSSHIGPAFKQQTRSCAVLPKVAERPPPAIIRSPPTHRLYITGPLARTRARWATQTGLSPGAAALGFSGPRNAANYLYRASTFLGTLTGG